MGTQLESLLTEKDNEGWSLLGIVAFHGDKTTFEAVLDAILTRLTPDQVRRFDV